jgi:hemerythrin superfamily protein
MATIQSNGAVGVLGAVQRDHRAIERMLSQVQAAVGDAKQEVFEQLVRKLAVHETAEEEVVHPLGKDAGIDAVEQTILSEEDNAKKALTQLDGMAVTSPEFEAHFEMIREKVLAHAEREEQQEHPQIASKISADKLERLASIFEMAERTAPTRPHASAPESRTGNLMIGPVIAVADRVRDALRDAKSKM